MTGRAAGYCAGYPYPGYMNPVPGFGRGFFGWGRGRGHRWWYYLTGLPGWARAGWFYPRYPYPPSYPAAPYYPPMSSEDELELLKEQAEFLKREMEAVEKRMEELSREGGK